MASNYARGRAFEYRTRDKLLKAGAVYIMRAASSKGAADLIALWPAVHVDERDFGFVYQIPWLIQCKFGKGTLPPAERATLINLATDTGAIPVLARRPKIGRGIEFINLITKEPLVV